MWTAAQLQHDYLKTKFKDIPIVLVDIAFREQQRSRVVFDNFQAGYDMTEALIKEGHRRIAIMVSPNHCMVKSSHDRYLGYCSAMQYAGISLRPEDKYAIDLNVGASDLRTILRKRQTSEDRWTAIVALHDGIAMSMVSIAEKQGIEIPSQMVVSGFDNYLEVQSSRYAVPTSVPDFFQAGKIAA